LKAKADVRQNVATVSEGRTNLLRMTRPCGYEPDFDSTLYARVCDYCGTESGGVRCIHDARQEPCPECDVVPVAQQC
jgi:hypothetical protein